MNRKVLFVFIVGLFLRLAYVIFAPQYEVNSDAKGYTILARSMLEGKGYSITPEKPDIHWPPGYPFFIAVIYKACGIDNNTAVRIVQSVLTSLLIVAVYLIAKKVFGERVGFTGSVIMCFYPAFIAYSGFLCPQTIAAVLLPLFVLSIIYLKRSFLAALGLGVVGGYATLVRPELLLCFLAVFAVLFLKSGQKRQAIKFILSAIITMGLVISIWTARNYRVSHRFIPVSAHLGDTVWLSTWKGDWQEWHTAEEPLASILKGRDFAEADNDLLKAGMDNLRKNPFIYLKLCAKRLFRFWMEGHSWTVYFLKDSTANYFEKGDYFRFSIKLFLLVFNAVLVFLGFCGMRIAHKRFSVNREIIHYMAASILCFVVFYCLTFSTGRYSVPVLPFMIIFASCSIGHVLRSAKKGE